MKDRRKDKARVKVRSCTVKSAHSRFLSFLKKPEENTHVLVNLSLGGASLLSKKAAEKGTPLDLTIDAPAFLETITAKAKVTWCKKVPGKDVFQVGVEFTRLSGDSKKRIARLLEEADLRIADRSQYLL